jgi:hypothetical protein
MPERDVCLRHRRYGSGRDHPQSRKTATFAQRARVR